MIPFFTDSNTEKKIMVLMADRAAATGNPFQDLALKKARAVPGTVLV